MNQEYYSRDHEDYYVNNDEEYPVIGTIEWLLMLILGMFPFVSFIMYIVFAFSKDTNPSKKTFAQWMLIVNIVVYALLVIVIVAIIMSGVLEELPQ